MSAVGTFPNRDALRRDLSWTRSPTHRTPILYTACRELPQPNRLGNRQGMLDSSGIKALPRMRPASDRIATRCVANPRNHFRDARKMVMLSPGKLKSVATCRKLRQVAVG